MTTATGKYYDKQIVVQDIKANNNTPITSINKIKFLPIIV